VLVLGRRFWGDERAALGAEQGVDAVAVVLKRAANDDFVPLVGLQREAKTVVAIEVIARRGTGEVRLVEHALRLFQLVPVDAGRVLLRDALARRAVEPELVPFDRTADADRGFD